MTRRLLAVVTLAAALVRLGARIAIAISDEIDDACSTYTVEIPDYVPDAWGVTR